MSDPREHALEWMAEVIKTFHKTVEEGYEAFSLGSPAPERPFTNINNGIEELDSIYKTATGKSALESLEEELDEERWQGAVRFVLNRCGGVYISTEKSAQSCTVLFHKWPKSERVFSYTLSQEEVDTLYLGECDGVVPGLEAFIRNAGEKSAKAGQQ